jgi:alginate O-acetyltransferase complex protein AlgI
MGLGHALTRLPRTLETAYTVLVVMLGWVLFRAPDFAVAGSVYRGLIGLNGIARISFDLHLALDPLALSALGVAAVLAFVPQWPSAVPLLRPRGGGVLTRGGAVAIAAVDTGIVLFLLLLAMTAVAAGTYSPFLYFRF